MGLNIFKFSNLRNISNLKTFSSYMTRQMMFRSVFDDFLLNNKTFSRILPTITNGDLRVAEPFKVNPD